MAAVKPENGPLYAGLKPEQGLYNPANEHDACGIGMICSIRNERSRKVVEDGLKILCNLEHRGAVGADPKAGDGAGILIQLPHEFFAAEMKSLGFDLPEPDHYGVAHLFMPRDPGHRQTIEAAYEMSHDPGRPEESSAGAMCRWILPSWVRASNRPNRFIARSSSRVVATSPMTIPSSASCLSPARLRPIMCADKHPEAAVGYYPVSCSSRTIVYKGLVLADGVAKYYKDLQDERVISALALVHQRFLDQHVPVLAAGASLPDDLP